MAGYMKELGNGKFKFEVSAGRVGGKRVKKYKTITVTGSTPEAQLKKAEKELAKFIGEVESGAYIEPTHLTFAGYVEQWKKDVERNLAPKTYHRYNELLNLHILKGLGHVQLEKLNPILIKQFYNTMREPVTYERKLKNNKVKKTVRNLSESTIKHMHRVVHLILEVALNDGLIKQNPCSKVKISVPKKEARSYDEEQIAALIEALEGEDMQFKTSIHIALAGGLRLGEIMGLEWSDINHENNTITISRASQYLPGKGLLTKAPKNESSKRTITLPCFVMNLINQLEHERKVQRMKLANIWQGSNRLFVTAYGAPMHPCTPSKWFNTLLKEKELPPLKFHELRHTSASYLIAQGENVVTVSKRLGHSNSNTTLAVYSHQFKKRDEAAASKMDKLYKTKDNKKVSV